MQKKLSQLPVFKLIVLIVTLGYSVYFLTNMSRSSSKDENTSVDRNEILIRDPALIKFADDKFTVNDGAKSSSNSLIASGERENDGPVLYAIVNALAGQQGAGMHSLVSFQTLTRQLASTNYSVKVLEPVLVNTQYYGLESTHKASIHFHDLFDMDHFNSASEVQNLPRFMMRKEFIEKAPKVAIYVSARQTPSGVKQRIRTIWSATPGRPCYESYQMSKKLKEMGYCVVKVIELSFVGYLRSIEELRKTIFDKTTHEQHVTIVFNEWRHYWLTPKLDFKTILRPSSRLILDVEFYEKTFLNSSNDVAVMFRVEHIIRFLQDKRNKNNMWTLEKCFQKAVEATLSKQKYGQPMITLDLGKYGSCSYVEVLRGNGFDVKKVVENAKSILSPLFGKDKVNGFSKWEESFSKASKGVQNGAYIAALQRTLASRAKCLILVGGGTFQLMSYDNYIVNHSKKEDQCVNMICNKYYSFKHSK